MDQAKERLRIGVERAIAADKWGRAVTNPKTQSNYSNGFAKFIGHPVPDAAASYMTGVDDANALGSWDARPTNLQKWANAMEMIR